MKVAIYIRISTDKSPIDHAGNPTRRLVQSTDMQSHDLEAYAKGMEWEISGVYTDKVSGRANFRGNKREGLNRLLKDAKKGMFQKVLVWKMDRLFRSLRGMIETISELQAMNVEFVSLKDPVDLSTAVGRFTFHILSAVAELESEMISERVKAGMRAGRDKGAKYGRVPKVNPDEVLAMRREGRSYGGIAEILGVNKSCVFRALHKSLKE